MAVRTYDPAGVTVSVGGYPIQGFADGTFINVERSADLFSKVVGADGFTSRSKSNDRSGTVTITLKQTSPSNDVLAGIQLLDEVSNQGVVPVMVKDINGNTLVFSESGWIRKAPTIEEGRDLTDREWAFDCADLDMFAGGNDESELS